LGLARRMADEHHGAFYLLDHDRGICRVLLGHGEDRHVLDFAAFQGTTLEEDLRNRDFTFNALAVDLRNTGQFIDPLHGAQDLRDKMVRLCSPTSLDSDPVRILRALRFAAEIGGTLDKPVIDGIRRISPLLARVSEERKRDELHKLLIVPRAAAALGAGVKLGVFDKFLGITDDSVAKAQRTEYLINYLMGTNPDNKAENLKLAQLAINLGPFKNQLGRYLRTQFTYGVYRSAQLLLASLGLDDARFGQLALSNDETRYLQFVKVGQDRLAALMKNEASLDDLKIFRYFKRIRECGIDAALLMIANAIYLQETEIAGDDLEPSLRLASKLLDAWFNRYSQVVEPKRFLDGHEVQQLIKVGPGPELGAILKNIEELQVSGEIKSRDDAIAACKRLSNP
ncbi:MAG TPA: hypothetical protein PKD55_18975, partial [Bellilinea sp.]|nr:hypothetical protein [Bellilinea sp.]